MKNQSLKKSETRQKILDAALVSFSQHGYQGTSIPMLAREAGLAVGSIYVHFKDKRTLVNELYRAWKREVIRRLTLIPKDLEFSQAFGRFWDTFVSFAQANPQAFLFLESHFHAPYLDADSFAVEEEVFALAGHFIQKGQKLGQIKKVSVGVVSGIFFGTLVQLFKQGEAKTWNESALADAKALIWDALRP